MITGNDLISWGYEPGPWFKTAIVRANQYVAQGLPIEEIRVVIKNHIPTPVEYLRRREAGEVPFHWNMDEAANEVEFENQASVMLHMRELMRVPTIKAGAVMPDACPSGSAKGTIPVGGVVATENAIHPGYHSADVCCSMAISVFDLGVNPAHIMDAGMKLSHFGIGGRSHSHDMRPSDHLLSQFEANPFLVNTTEAAIRHFGTQGDGNHFYYVGLLKSTGQVALVTHHGSRKPGALLYKAGKAAAERSTKKIAPSIPGHQAWIIADSEEGQAYWEAMQIIRTWTKKSHFAIHDAVAKYVGAKLKDRFWNEHNFVFQKSDGLFYHAKGATPAYPYFAADTDNRTLIPMNMGEPILITKGLNSPNGLGFSPHGAGRNFSRTFHKQQHSAEAFAEELLELGKRGLDIRAYSGTQDYSELPSGYKNAAEMRRQIGHFGLAEVIDEVTPYGTIMAGEIDWKRDWRKD
jgi:RNA-splicing ligase RtcB